MEFSRIMKVGRQLIVLLDTIRVEWAQHVLKMHYILLELPRQLIMLLDTVCVGLAHILNELQRQTRRRLEKFRRQCALPLSYEILACIIVACCYSG